MKRRCWPAKLLLWFPLFLLLAACGNDETFSDNGGRDKRSTPVAAAIVEPRDLSRYLNISAKVAPRMIIRLAARTSGTLEDVLVDVGDNVKKGQLLARLDAAEQNAELARATAEEERAELDYQRTADLHKRGVASRAQYQQALADWQVRRSERELWETRLAFTRVVSPRDAVVTARHIEPGEAIQQQGALFELSVMDELLVSPGVSELDVVHLRVGQAVPIQLDALPDLQLLGEISRIFPAASARARLLTVEVSLPQDATHKGVKPGFLARLSIAVDAREQVLTVPSAAIGSHEGQSYVYVIDDERLQRRMIEVGVSRGQWTEVLNGLGSGEVVLASNPIDMRDKQRVRIAGWRG